MKVLSNEAIDSFRSALTGGIVLPNDPNYDEVRTIWNAMIDRKPSVIVQCSGADDVVAQRYN